MGNRREIYDVILGDSVLSDTFKYIVLNNTSNNAPYHNFNHMMIVTKYIYNAYQESNEFSDLNYHNILLAGMFHDMNHSMGKEDDSYNVQSAISALKSWYIHAHDLKNEYIDFDVNEIANIIRATQYPYIIEDEDLTVSQMLIRDCDMMMGFEDDWFQNTVLGLKSEMNVDNIPRMIEGNIEFRKNAHMRTQWGKDLYKSRLPDLLNKLRKLEKLFSE